MTRAERLVGQYATRREADDADRVAEFGAVAAKAKVLLTIAQAPNDTKTDAAKIRERLDAIREIVIDLLGAPLVEENITGDDWYSVRLDTDKAKIQAELAKVGTDLEGDAGAHAQQIRDGMKLFTESIDTFEAGARRQGWSSLVASRKSLDALIDQTESLGEATDDLSALVSEKPWRSALDRLRLVKLVSGGDRAFLKEQWAAAIVAGAEAKAKSLQDDHEWYDALGLYMMLADLYDNDGRYEKVVKHVTRQARVISLYAPKEAAVEVAATTPSEPKSESTEPAKTAKAKDPKWKSYILGVDAFMVRLALARIDEAYVKSVDYRKVMLGGLGAVKALVESPGVRKSFPSMADDAKRAAFAERLDALVEEASEAEGVTYRMVGVCLNQVIWANNQTVDIPDEVIDVEFTDGMMKELDRFSSMIWPSEWPEFKKHTMGSFKGVGIHIQMQSQTDLLRVVSPLENSPAYRAGIKAGDLIMKINGESAKGIDIEEAVKRITGPEGTKVTLAIKRPGRQDVFDVALEREEIHIQTVKGWRRTNGGGWDWMIDPENRIGYVRLTSFNRETTTDLKKSLKEMAAHDVQGLILDLRDNPGGLLTEAVSVTDQFVRQGKIVSTRGRQQRSGQLFANNRGSFLEGELVVLIDERSASAAEIVSGALKDLNRGVIVGTRSFGKGSVQNLIPIRQDPAHAHDAYLKLTTAYYYLPSDRCLHRIEGATEWGVEPDIKPTVTPRQKRRWLVLRSRTEIIKQRDEGELDGDMAAQFRADIPLDTALLVCQMRLLRASRAQQAVAEANATVTTRRNGEY